MAVLLEVVEVVEVELLLLPNPRAPLRVLEGFRAWNARWLVVGRFSGALMLVAVLPAFGDVTGELTLERVLGWYCLLYTSDAADE